LYLNSNEDQEGEPEQQTSFTEITAAGTILPPLPTFSRLSVSDAIEEGDEEEEEEVRRVVLCCSGAMWCNVGVVQ
jgi:hypothetical protein